MRRAWDRREPPFVATGSVRGALPTHFWPGATEEQYRATIAVVQPPNGLPDGQVYHAAGPTERGFQGQPEERAAQIYNLETT
jgi:hypothetical protein